MARAKSRFTQADVTKLIKAAKGTGFGFVAIEVLPGEGGLKATYSMGEARNDQPSRFEEWNSRRAKERELEAAPVMSDEEWAAAVRASELSSREKMALEALFARRGRDIPHNEIKGAGIATQESLEVRGYAAITMDGDRFVSWRITQEGERFCRQISSLPPHL